MNLSTYINILHFRVVCKVCVFLFFSLSLTAQGPQLGSNSISIKEGLASRKVKNLFQDSHGWIWITTDISLHRFDGYKVERMDDKLDIFIDQTIRTEQIIWEDKNKLIWIKDENQMVQFEPLSGTVRRFEFTDTIGNTQMILFSLLDHKGRMLIKNKGSNLKVYENGTFIEIPNSNGSLFNEFKEEHILSMQLDGSEGYILQASKYKSYLLDKDFKIYKAFYRNQFRPSKGMDDFGFSIQKDGLGRIFGEVRFDFFYEYDSQLDSFVLPHYLKGFPIKSKIGVFPDQNTILFSSKGEVWHYDYQNQNLSKIKKDGVVNSDQIIEQMLIDQTKNLWLATYFGAQKINSPQTQFESIDLNNDLNKSYANSTRSIVNISEHELLIGAKFTNFIYNLIDGSIAKLPHYKNDMWSTVKAEGDLWGVRLGDPGVYKFDKRNKKFDMIRFPIDANLPVIIDYYDGHLWTGDGPYIFKYHIKSKKWQSYKWDKGRVNDFYFENANSFFLACNKGLIHVDSTLQILKEYSSDSEVGLSSNKIQNIYVDDEGLFWLSTKGGGVNILNPRLESVEVLDVNTGLPNNTVYSVIPDEDKYWMPTDNGLALYDKSTKNVNSFFTEHGLSHNEFNFPSQFVYKDKIYLGTLDGITVIDTAKSYLNDLQPKLFITSISTYDQKLKQNRSHELDYNEDHPLVIKPNESNLEISVSLADYTNLEENKFAYQLDGMAEEWTQLGNNHIIQLGTLPSGKYKFNVIGYTNSGMSTDKIISFPVVVKQPFTKSKTFIFLLIGLLSGLFYLFYKIRLRQLQKVTKIRQRIAANLHDEVGSVMTHIALESDLLLANIYEGHEIDKKLEEIAQNSREASTVMSDIVWSFDWQQDKTKNLVDRMHQFLHKMLTSKDIKFELNAEKLKMNKEMTPDVRQNVYLIFKEAIHNIVKHSNASAVVITMVQKRNKLFLSIDDDGDDDYESHSISSGQGVRNMHYRAKNIGAELEIVRRSGYHIRLNVVTT